MVDRNIDENNINPADSYLEALKIARAVIDSRKKMRGLPRKVVVTFCDVSGFEHRVAVTVTSEDMRTEQNLR